MTKNGLKRKLHLCKQYIPIFLISCSQRRIQIQRIYFIAFIGMSLLVTGCYLHRSYAPLEKEQQPKKITAILPVTIATILNKSTNIPSEKVAQVANAVLNTQTKPRNDKILGPAELESILEDRDLLRIIDLCIYSPIDENFNAKELKELTKPFGITTIVRTFISISDTIYTFSEMSGGGGGIGKDLKGFVEVRVDLLDFYLIPPQIIKSSTGNAEYSSTAGLFGGGGSGAVFILPFAYGKTLGRAVDQAIRDALSRLFQQEPESRDRFIERLPELVSDEYVDW